MSTATTEAPNPLDHQGLVRKVALLHCCPGIDFEDILQAGQIGLLEACRGFDPTRGVRFSTYAVPAIRNAIQREVHCWVGLARVPDYLHDIAWRVDQGLIAEADLAPGERANLADARRAMAGWMGRGSFDDRHDRGNENRLWLDERAVDHHEADPNPDVLDRLRAAVAALPAREREVIGLRYGFDQPKGLAWWKIGVRMGLGRWTVIKIGRRAIGRLRGAVDIEETHRPKRRPAPLKRERRPYGSLTACRGVAMTRTGRWRVELTLPGGVRAFGGTHATLEAARAAADAIALERMGIADYSATPAATPARRKVHA